MTAALAGPGDAHRLAALHAEAFDPPWPDTAFADLLDQPGMFGLTTDDGFILIRAVADEAEILTLAVRPSARRRGLARALVEAARVHASTLGAERMFLEVAVGNTPARALYQASGFSEAGRRRDYYARPDGSREDALILSIPLA